MRRPRSPRGRRLFLSPLCVLCVSAVSFSPRPLCVLCVSVVKSGARGARRPAPALVAPCAPAVVDEVAKSPLTYARFFRCARWDPAGKAEDNFFVTTKVAAEGADVVEVFACRRGIEGVFREGKQLVRFSKVEGWSPRSVERQAPFALFVLSLVKGWLRPRGGSSGAPRRVTCELRDAHRVAAALA